MTLRNIFLATLLGFGMVGFAAWQYQETGGPALHRQLQIDRDQKAQERAARELSVEAIPACQAAARSFIKNPTTIDWDVWNSTSRYQGGGVWVHRIPLTAQNDMGVAKSLVVRCQTVGAAVIGLTSQWPIVWLMGLIGVFFGVVWNVITVSRRPWATSWYGVSIWGLLASHRGMSSNS